MSPVLMSARFASLLWLVVFAFFASGVFTADAGTRLLSDHQMREQARGGEPTCDRGLLYARCTDFVNPDQFFWDPQPGPCGPLAQGNCTGSCEGCTEPGLSHIRCWTGPPWVITSCTNPRISGGCGVYRNPPMSCFWDTQFLYCRCGGGSDSTKP